MRLLHPGMALFAYAAGATLLFGGPRLLRRAFAPLCLLLLLDPVPHFFNKWLDLPLQTLSADTARAFAHLIGLRPTGEQLRMMFAPNFGMFIAPGCNGIRGSITFGYLALIFGYIRRLPPRTLAAFTAAAVLLGYLFNLLRLCTLVLYYRAGISFPAIRPYGTQVDYAIGVTLFLLATLATGFVITVYQYRHSLTKSLPSQEVVSPRTSSQSTTKSPLPRALALAAVALLFFIPQARSAGAAFHPPLSAETVLAAFPHQVSGYTLTHTYEELDSTGQLMFLFGDYVQPATHESLSLGIYVASEEHYVFVSKLLQGLRPETQSTLTASSPGGGPVHLFTSFYRTGDALTGATTFTMDAETSCRQSLCDINLAGNGGKVGIVSPHLADLLVTPAARRVPLLLSRTVALTAATAQPEVEASFRTAVQQFMAALDVQPLLTAAE